MKSAAIYRFQILIGLMFIAAGVAKLAGVDIMVRQFEVIGLGQWFRPVAGTMEIIGGLSLFIPRIASFGAALLACTILGSTGAIIGHVAIAGGSRHQVDKPQVTSAKYYEIRCPDCAIGRPEDTKHRSQLDI